MKACNKFVIYVCIIFLVIIHTGCSSTGKPFTPIPMSGKDSGKAAVYIYRESKVLGCALAPSVKFNGKHVGKIVNGGYFALPVEANKRIEIRLYDPAAENPGKFLVTTTVVGGGPVGLAAGAIALAAYKEMDCGTYTFNPGKSYYFRYRIVSFAKTELSPVSNSVGESEIRQCKMTKDK